MSKKNNPEGNAFRIIFVSGHGVHGQPVPYVGDEPPDAEEMIRHYILPIRPNRADRRKVVPKQAVLFLYKVA